MIFCFFCGEEGEEERREGVFFFVWLFFFGVEGRVCFCVVLMIFGGERGFFGGGRGRVLGREEVRFFFVRFCFFSKKIYCFSVVFQVFFFFEGFQCFTVFCFFLMFFFSFSGLFMILGLFCFLFFFFIGNCFFAFFLKGQGIFFDKSMLSSGHSFFCFQSVSSRESSLTLCVERTFDATLTLLMLHSTDVVCTSHHESHAKRVGHRRVAIIIFSFFIFCFFFF